MNRPVIIAIAIATPFLGRLAYTENARSQMIDFNAKTAAAKNDPALRREYDEKLGAHLKAKCSISAEEASEQRNDYIRLFGKDTDPLRECEKEETGRFGYYETWVEEQLNLEASHPWAQYPSELKDRLSRGERGLLLGSFWKYIL